MSKVKIHEIYNKINVYSEGRPGSDGLSAYDIWLIQGNVGSESDFLNSLIGPSGSAGSGSATIPNGTVSGSSQIIFNQISNVPPGLYSSSLQEYDPIFISKSGSFVLTSSYQLDSGSWNSTIFNLNESTSSFALKTEISGAFQLPTFVLSASHSETASYFDLPEGLISSSNQIAGNISGSFTNLSSSLSTRITSIESNSYISSSEQIDFNSIQNKPTNIESASFALTASYVSGSSANSISSSYAISSSQSDFATTSSYNLSSSYSQTSSFATNVQTIGIKIKTYDSFISEGSKAFKHIGYNSNIIKVIGISNIEGNINLNIRRNGTLLGNFNLTNQSSSIDSSLSSWSTTQLSTDDLIEFYVSQSSTYITEFTFFMDLQNR